MPQSPAHRSTTSLSQPLVGSTPKQQRRMTSPTTNASLTAPEVPKPQGRPPSPLRNEFVPDTSTGIDPDESFSDDEDDDFENHQKWQERSPSPSSSVSQLAASITQRVGNFLGTMAPRSSGGMPTDAELEAEAERERERSRREAERILTREAEERKLVEERVLEMMNNARSLPPPPSRTGSNPPSPSGSQKDSLSNWWAAAKNKLTPTKDKDSPTPAQQVILDTKAREQEKEKKNKGKEKEKDDEFATNDPAQSLNLPLPPHRKPVPPSPSSPTPSRPSLSNMAPNLTPSPMRSMDPVSSSPSREAPLLYAQFNTQGTLDMPGTLLTIAKRFEKLEKWTVGHVRALEERMSDVERWLVDKEKEKEREKAQADEVSASTHTPSPVPSEITHEIQDLRDGLTELQSRVGSLGREMAKFATSPSNLSSGPSRQPAPVSTAPQTPSTRIVYDVPASPSSPSPLPPLPVVPTTPLQRRLSSTARDSTSPPMVSSKTSGTRLPYPTGDYATPPDSTVPLQGPFASPPHSPPTSLTPIRPLSISGLGQGLGILQTESDSSLRSSASASNTSTHAASPQQQVPASPTLAKTSSSTTSTTTSTPNSLSQSQSQSQSQAQSQAQAHGLPAPRRPLPRPASVSPTPRKRYTVALGEPIVSPPDSQRRPSPRPAISGSPTPTPTPGLKDGDQEDWGLKDETIGKSASARFVHAQPMPTNGDYKSTFGSVTASMPTASGPTPSSSSSSASPSPASKRRLRAQSAYGFIGVQALTQSSQPQPQTPTVAPLRPKLRSRSTERTPGPEQSFPTGRFVDPLVARRQEREKGRGREGEKERMRGVRARRSFRGDTYPVNVGFFLGSPDMVLYHWQVALMVCSNA
ncbi:hypothetical protein C0995_012085 [Termitomyces sp. Mi166|nr:hypothetical protein C0995_012085 [Termitomyces sp. Mi166\